MLHATVRHKTRFFERYLARSQEDSVHRERRVCAEDEITSVVFGPLAFMDGAGCALFCRTLLAQHGLEELLPHPDPDGHSVELWPPGGRFEPDVVIEFEWANLGKRRLIFELKWRSDLSGSEQLRNQWQEYAVDPGRASECVHVFLALDSRKVEADHAASHNGAAHRLVALDWHRLRDVLDGCVRQGEQPGLALWAQLSLDFLRASGVRTFEGFRDAALAGLRPLHFHQFFDSGTSFFDSLEAPRPIVHRPFFRSSRD